MRRACMGCGFLGENITKAYERRNEPDFHTCAALSCELRDGCESIAAAASQAAASQTAAQAAAHATSQTAAFPSASIPGTPLAPLAPLASFPTASAYAASQPAAASQPTSDWSMASITPKCGGLWGNNCFRYSIFHICTISNLIFFCISSGNCRSFGVSY